MRAERDEMLTVTCEINGRRHHVAVEARTSLADLLRGALGLAGTHLGCEQGVCGACTVLLDGQPVRSCLMLAAQAEEHAVTTVEGLARGGELSPLQKAFWENHGFQCGFCTPGMLLAATALLAENPRPTADEVRAALNGNLCRCTGYEDIVAAVLAAAGE